MNALLTCLVLSYKWIDVFFCIFLNNYVYLHHQELEVKIDSKTGENKKLVSTIQRIAGEKTNLEIRLSEMKNDLDLEKELHARSQ